jgi:iron complex outermembrane receptor protein
VLAEEPGISGVRIEAVGKDGRQIVGSRGALVTRATDLRNSMGDPIGSISLGFARRLDTKAQNRALSSIAANLSRHIYMAANLLEADPFVPGARRSAHAQAIVERMMAANRDLVTLAFHIGESGASNEILASNFGRIGKPGDADDAQVIDHGATLREVTNGGRRAAIELPLLDRHGRIVGALSTSFVVGAGGAEAAARRAAQVRNEIAGQIDSLSQISR